MNRIDRLTAILIHLQTKRVVRAQDLADRFGISLRTVYRDIRSLEEAGVPIGAEAGVGYFLTNYHLPPVMFTNAEASALLFGGKLIEKLTDQSVRTEFESALYKIKSVLKRPDQDHLDSLEAHINVAKPSYQTTDGEGSLNTLQHAIAQQHVLELQYYSHYNNAETRRRVEPVGLYHYRSSWHLIAFCQIRQDYRDFRVDRIRQLTDTAKHFSRRDRLSLQEYLDRVGKLDMPLMKATIIFQKSATRYMQEQKHAYGFQSEEDLGDFVRIHFQTPYPEGLARWLIMYGKLVTIEQPDSLKAMIRSLVDELNTHYMDSTVL
ncbi:helix-turn-helix transcriptional regulator [Spirosoma fluviale]|uniref:Predicted DNA-binding transcriptional regulator YafY, contains an HTH and WYL domains n=1 Tax=Spirosoma fluviale TaxID=1597977 RepID=A0A286FA40_9BACT|nr:YafY family protein [Spirosoma fluviale]SOD80108.1 Predicted DNA-binding transcriptional regulator YafY, contains an HTH and WYL domains [Spirosoma fluviale]